MLDYFTTDSIANLDKKRRSIQIRRSRNRINGFSKAFYFSVGDILEVVFMKWSLPFIFEGVCIAIKKRKLLSPEVSFILRNIILGVIIEMTFSYYYNRLYRLKFYDYKRKIFLIRRSKLFLIRTRLNRESRVK